MLCGAAYADQPAPEKTAAEPVIEQAVPPCPSGLEPESNESLNQSRNDDKKLFSLGRSVGASYFYLINLSDNVEEKPFSELQQEYSKTFQNINIIDIILEDLDIYGKSRENLKNLRINFYNALKTQDLSETHIAFVRDLFVVFYENLTRDIAEKYPAQGSWLLSLGFYSSFQLESLNSPNKEKVLLSGFDKILSSRPVTVPEEVYASLLEVNKLDKMYVSTSELTSLRSNLLKITDYFTNYPATGSVFEEAKDLIGVWQGILVNPENERHDIRLVVKKDLSAKMSVAGIAEEISISDVEIVNNYFTFMFKPFGTEKLYLRFDAKLSENMFTGEITDVLGSKGCWVLAKTNKNNKLSEEKLDKMVSYLSRIEEKLKEQAVIEINELKTEKNRLEEAQQETTEEVRTETPETIEELYRETLATQEEPPAAEEPVAEQVDEQPENKKGMWAKFINLLKKMLMMGEKQPATSNQNSTNTLITPLPVE